MELLVLIQQHASIAKMASSPSSSSADPLQAIFEVFTHEVDFLMQKHDTPDKGRIREGGTPTGVIGGGGSEGEKKELLDWINSFTLPRQCKSLGDLRDGFLFSCILHLISPNDFPYGMITSLIASSESSNNNREEWMEAQFASNLNILWEKLADYYRNKLQRKFSHSLDDHNTTFSATSDGSNYDGDASNIWLIIDAVVGAVVFSENCHNYNNYMLVMQNLSETAQNLLSNRIKIINELSPYIDNSRASSFDLSSTPSKDVEGRFHMNASDLLSSLPLPLPAKEVLGSISQETVVRIVSENSNLVAQNAQMQFEINRLRIELGSFLQKSKLDEEHLKSIDKKHNGSELLIKTLQLELAELRRELDLRMFEFDEVTHQLIESKNLYQATHESNIRLSKEVQRLMDDLELHKDNADKLSKAENKIDAYSVKLDDLARLKKQNTSLEDKLDKYLDRIHELESANKTVASFHKGAEHLRISTKDLELENSQLKTQMELQRLEIERNKSESERLTKTCTSIENQLHDLRLMNKSLTDKLNHNHQNNSDRNNSDISKSNNNSNSSDVRHISAQTFLHAHTGHGGAPVQLFSVATSKEKVHMDGKDGVHRSLSFAKLAEGSESKLSESAEEKSRIITEQETTIALLTAENECLKREKFAGTDDEKLTRILLLELENSNIMTRAKRVLTAFKDKYLRILTEFKKERALEQEHKYQQNKTDKSDETIEN